MDNNFKGDEALYRAVRPLPMFIKDDGTITSGAFKDKCGLSVERGNYRTDASVVETMRPRFDGKIV